MRALIDQHFGTEPKVQSIRHEVHTERGVLRQRDVIRVSTDQLAQLAAQPLLVRVAREVLLVLGLVVPMRYVAIDVIHVCDDGFAHSLR